MESTAPTQDGLQRNFRAENLNVYIYESRGKMGKAAAEVIASEIRNLIDTKGRAAVSYTHLTLPTILRV